MSRRDGDTGVPETSEAMPSIPPIGVTEFHPGATSPPRPLNAQAMAGSMPHCAHAQGSEPF